jgi:hypothetical protein
MDLMKTHLHKCQGCTSRVRTSRLTWSKWTQMHILQGAHSSLFKGTCMDEYFIVMEVVKWTKALLPRVHLFKDHFMIILLLSTKHKKSNFIPQKQEGSRPRVH